MGSRRNHRDKTVWEEAAATVPSPVERVLPCQRYLGTRGKHSRPRVGRTVRKRTADDYKKGMHGHQEEKHARRKASLNSWTCTSHQHPNSRIYWKFPCRRCHCLRRRLLLFCRRRSSKDPSRKITTPYPRTHCPLRGSSLAVASPRQREGARRKEKKRAKTRGSTHQTQKRPR